MEKLNKLMNNAIKENELLKGVEYEIIIGKKEDSLLVPLSHTIKTNIDIESNSFTGRFYFDTNVGFPQCGIYAMEHEDDRKEVADIIESNIDHVYCTSDWHIRKKDIHFLISDLQRTLKENDILLCLGDITYYDDIMEQYSVYKGKPMSERRKYWIDGKKILSSIKCKYKILVIGNHDEKLISEFKKDGWDYVVSIIETSKYVFTHVPTVTNKINIHGHNHHNGKLYGKMSLSTKRFDVGYIDVDRLTYPIYKLTSINYNQVYRMTEPKYDILGRSDLDCSVGLGKRFKGNTSKEMIIDSFKSVPKNWKGKAEVIDKMANATLNTYKKVIPDITHRYF